MTDKNEYNDDRFNKLSQKLNNILSSRQLKTPSEAENKKFNYNYSEPAEIHNELENNLSYKNYSKSDSSLCSIDIKSKQIEEKTFKLIKDQELKVNLLQDDINFLVKSIEEDKLNKENLKDKLSLEIKKTENKLIGLIESERINSELNITSIFAQVEANVKEIESFHKNEESINYEFERLKNQINIGVANIQNDLSTQEINKNKEIPEIFNEITNLINDLNIDIMKENQCNQQKEDIIITEIEKNLRNIKSNFSEYKIYKIKYEDTLLTNIEGVCSELIYNFKISDN